jgi:anti-sigma factor RsiW
MRPRRTPRAPLTCRQVGRLLQSYLDDELHDTRVVLVADHLDACLRCGLDASSYRWLKAQLAGLASSEDVRQLARVRVFVDALLDEPV